MNLSLKNDVAPFVELLEELLTSLYLDAVRELDSISETTAQMRNDIKEIGGSDTNAELKDLKENCDRLVMQSQFADRISQRIDNTRKIVFLMRELMGKEFETDLHDWYETIEKIRSSFTMEQEHAVLEKVFNFGKMIDATNHDDGDDSDMQTY